MRRWITTLTVLTITASMASAARRPNVLFIAVDDLRPQINCYGKSFMHTPHLDRLAERGVLFERAYCMVPTCGASRASLMSGIRPAANRFVNYLAWAQKDVPGVTTLNTHFKGTATPPSAWARFFIMRPTTSTAGPRRLGDRKQATTTIRNCKRMPWPSIGRSTRIGRNLVACHTRPSTHPTKATAMRKMHRRPSRI